MSEYQIMLLRFMRMRADNPHLKHEGHEPEPFTRVNGVAMRSWWVGYKQQRLHAEREFYRFDYPQLSLDTP